MKCRSSISDQQVLDAFKAAGTIYGAAKKLGRNRNSIKERLQRLGALGDAGVKAESSKTAAENNGNDAEVQALRTQVAQLLKEQVNAEYVRRQIFKLKDSKPSVPDWLLGERHGSSSLTGIPTLFASDWHWGEVVDPAQINGVNQYNLEIARARARALIDKACYLLFNCLAEPNYEGIVFALGGDMVSGDIHDELSVSNEAPIMPTVIDLYGVLAWCVKTLADRFGKVFVPCVTGNHGRNTHKIRAKGRSHTSFDWLLYTMLEKHFEDDLRVAFQVPLSSDAHFRVYNHRYVLTHGDQFRGGDGMIGALGPIIRGDHRKRSRNMQIDLSYDTLMLGHWHQVITLRRLIVNGSLVGYSEYPWMCNFPFEPPQQALWITHPEHGITFAMPVNVEGSRRKADASPWVSVFDESVK